MAITWTEDADSRENLGISGIQQQNLANFATSDYATGGYAIAAAAFGLARIRGLYAVGLTGTTEGWLWQFDSTTKKLKAYGGVTAGAEAAANTDFSGGTLTVKAEGF